MEQALSRAVKAHHELQEAENDLYSLIKGHDGNDEAVIDEKLLDDIRDLISSSLTTGGPSTRSQAVKNQMLELLWEDFVEDHLHRKARAASGRG